MTKNETKNHPKNFLKSYAQALNISMDDIAEFLGVAMPTVWRYANNQRKLNIDTALIIWMHFGFPAEDVGRLFTTPPDPAYFAKHDVAWHGKAPSTTGTADKMPIMQFRSITVIGRVQAGLFTQAWQLPEDEQFKINVPEDDGYPKNLPRFGLIVEGDSMDKLFQPGTIITNIPFDHLGRVPKDGDCVVIKRRDKYGPGVECTVKGLQMLSDGEVRLWPKSTNPQYQTPIVLKPGQENEEDVVIKSLVVGATLRVGKLTF